MQQVRPLKHNETNRNRPDTRYQRARRTMALMFNTPSGVRKATMKHFFKRNFKRTVLGLLGATIVLGGLTACGQRHHEFGAQLSAEEYAEKRTKIVDRVAGKLDLNEDQKK